MLTENLFTTENKQRFIQNISKFVNLDYYLSEWDLPENIFEEMTYHKDIWLLIDDIIHHISEWKYCFLNSFDEDSEFSPQDPDYRLIDIKKSGWWDNVSEYIDWIREWDDPEIDVEVLLLIDHTYFDDTLEEILDGLLIELESKDNKLYNQIVNLFIKEDLS